MQHLAADDVVESDAVSGVGPKRNQFMTLGKKGVYEAVGLRSRECFGSTCQSALSTIERRHHVAVLLAATASAIGAGIAIPADHLVDAHAAAATFGSEWWRRALRVLASAGGGRRGVWRLAWCARGRIAVLRTMRRMRISAWVIAVAGS